MQPIKYPHRLPTKVAKYLGKLPGGTKVYRVPVKARLNDSSNHHTWGREREEWHQVHASSVAEAANAIRDLYKFRPETEVFAYGPKGGETYRYVGWESAIAAHLWEEKPINNQLSLL